MKYCSLCAREYDDEATSCQLSHCVSCGSTRLWSDQHRTVNPISVMVLAGFFALIFTSIFMDTPTTIYIFMGMFAVIVGYAISGSFQSKTIHLCLECYSKGFNPIKNANLHESKPEIQTKFNQKSLDEIQKVLKPKIGIEGSFNLRNLVMILSLIVATIAMIFGQTIQKFVELNFQT